MQIDAERRAIAAARRTEHEIVHGMFTVTSLAPSRSRMDGTDAHNLNALDGDLSVNVNDETDRPHNCTRGMTTD